MKKLALLLLPLLTIGTFVFAYTAEQKEAYDWAYSKWITTQPLEKADLDWNVTRQALAKMLIRFHESRYWEVKYISDPNACQFLDKGSITEDLKPFVHAACEFELMGVWTKYFNPLWSVTRAQFGTVLSRLLYWGNYDGWNPYYKKHLDALKKHWIMKYIDSPEMLEKRGDIMIMLKRANEVLDKEIEDLMNYWSNSDGYKITVKEIK